MAERPILFSGPMVQAILAGRKTQTRRVMKPQPNGGIRRTMITIGGISNPLGLEDGHGRPMWCPYGKPGDLLWVRETWAHKPGTSDCSWYAADFTTPDAAAKSMGLQWKPSIHMHRWRSRITLRITDVRVEQLQNISDNDALSEGIAPVFDDGIWSHNGHVLPRDGFVDLWESINGKTYPWESNPWVWIVSFETVKS